jgi:RNA polymerase sporulation-specific sigma factor
MMSPDSLPDQCFFQSFIDRKILEKIARKQTRNTGLEWEDAAQVAYEKIWYLTQQGKFYTGDVDDFCRWAAKVAYFAIIDYRRQSKNQQLAISLDQVVPGTDISLLEALVFEFDALEAIAKADLLHHVVSIITEIDQRYPQYHYLKIWQGLLQGKKQLEIAAELRIDRPEICRRWKNIRQYVAENCFHPQKAPPQKRSQYRQRSAENWE